MNKESKGERDFSMTVKFSSALGYGAILALSRTLRVGKPAISFDPSIWTAIAFLIGFNSVFAYLQFVSTCWARTPRLFRRGGLVTLVVMTAGTLLYPFRSLQLDKLAERFEGVGAAVCFIAIGLVLILRIVLTSERAEQRQERKNKIPLQSSQHLEL